MSLGPDCPRCGHPVGFWSVQWGRGRGFPCRGCGQRLVVPKAGVLAIVPILAGLYALRDRLADNPYGWLIVPLVVVLLGIAEYLMLRVRPASEGTP